ncbi:MAG TPA: hypothetical protein DCW50_01870 [Gammaproteobacteria bacterium]|jgi:NhaP-type Na+/H+ or K+/H+ antiporter|nr:MAG: hypothetical protein CBC11_006480 [Proteobacteria bacterium TMED51]HAU40770.1 hypothetical protein [Gammaproteobacteria bacterium]|tara:strand:+ start:4952 stop:6163 length:1212 start_codon:yes stop_codon:yes gene_type:complete
MEYSDLAILSGIVLLFGICSSKLRSWNITGPMALVTLGVVVTVLAPTSFQDERNATFIEIFAEVTLILVLFSDAANLNLRTFIKDHNLAQRMLMMGMPLSILLGTIFALLLFEQIGIVEAALLAAILAPTDAALGQAVVSSPKVPSRIRQTLNTESGLNDGIALPMVLFFVCMASAVHDPKTAEYWLKFGAMQLILGPLAGWFVASVSANALNRAMKTAVLHRSVQGIANLSTAFLAFAGAEQIGGNGFIAAFVAGLVFGNMFHGDKDFLFDFGETQGMLLTLVTFFFFGLTMVPMLFKSMEWSFVIYGVLSLTLVRLVPVAISLIGTGLPIRTVSFLGWFGPRGLASILFVLLILEDAEIANEELILVVTITTVVLSVFAHGLSAGPAARRWGIASNPTDTT